VKIAGQEEFIGLQFKLLSIIEDIGIKHIGNWLTEIAG
jgi:hypothetical protein